MADFISAGTIEAGLVLPEDALDHEGAARRLLGAARHLPAGSVVGLQGGWGRGKTDVLARMVAQARAGGGVSWLWINPWQYGTPDLLSPLVLALLERLPPDRRAGGTALRKAAQSVVMAGLSFGLKATRATAPGGGLLLEAADSASQMLQHLFDAAELGGPAPPPPDPDPVARMGRRFCELVEALLAAEGTEQVLICVDDLDRCLPDRQVALLQAMRFLTSAGAEATFVVALDPALARQALLLHYGTAGFDADLYLDKMFALRVELPAVGEAGVRALVLSRLRQGAVAGALGAAWPERLADQAAGALCVPVLRNPRLIRRVVDRLELLAGQPWSDARDRGLREALEGRGAGEQAGRWLLMWLALCERWPRLRGALQPDTAELGRRLPLLHRRYTAEPALRTGIASLDELPEPTAADRQLWGVLGAEQISAPAVQFIARLERCLLAAGL